MLLRNNGTPITEILWSSDFVQPIWKQLVKNYSKYMKILYEVNLSIELAI